MKLIAYLIKKAITNDDIEIRVNTRIKTGILIKNNNIFTCVNK